MQPEIKFRSSAQQRWAACSCYLNSQAHRKINASASFYMVYNNRQLKGEQYALI